MAYSYRQDSSDDLTSDGGSGPSTVAGLPVGQTRFTATEATKYQIAASPIVVYTADGAITIAHQNAVISKAGSAAAMTLAAPTAGTQDGLIIRLISGTAYAHVITATGLIDDGVTGGAKNTVTLG